MISDEELTRLALGGDPDILFPDAVPIQEVLGTTGVSTLPEWYMPPVTHGLPRLRGWRRGLVFSFIAALIVIEAFGLCSTYGQII